MIAAGIAVGLLVGWVMGHCAGVRMERTNSENNARMVVEYVERHTKLMQRQAMQVQAATAMVGVSRAGKPGKMEHLN